MYGINIPYVRKPNSVHTGFLFRMYGIMFPYVRNYVSVRTKLIFRTYGNIIPLKPKPNMAAEEDSEAAVPPYREWELKNRNSGWLRDNLNDIYRNGCERACSRGPVPLDYEKSSFLGQLRSEMVNAFWHLYLKEFRDEHLTAKFTKSDCLGKSRLDQMMRVFSSTSNKSFIHDIEKWEYAIKELDQGWMDFFRNSVFPVLQVSAAASEREPETGVPRRRKKAVGTACHADTEDVAKARSIFEIPDDEERQSFFRDFKCVHTTMQDPLEEDGEPPTIEGLHSSVLNLEALSDDSDIGRITVFRRALAETKAPIVRFDASYFLTSEEQASYVEMVEKHGLNDYRPTRSRIPFPEDKLRLVPIWSRLLLEQRSDDSIAQGFFKYDSVTEYDMGRLHATGPALQALVTARPGVSPLVSGLFETGSAIYRQLHTFVAAGDPLMKGVDTNLSVSGLSILCSRNLSEEDALQVETICNWCVGGRKKEAGGGGGAEEEEEAGGGGAGAADGGGGAGPGAAEGGGGAGAGVAEGEIGRAHV